MHAKAMLIYQKLSNDMTKVQEKNQNVQSLSFKE